LISSPISIDKRKSELTLKDLQQQSPALSDIDLTSESGTESESDSGSDIIVVIDGVDEDNPEPESVKKTKKKIIDLLKEYYVSEDMSDICLYLLENYQHLDLKKINEITNGWKEIIVTTCCCTSSSSNSQLPFSEALGPIKPCLLVIRHAIVLAIEQKTKHRQQCVELIKTLRLNGVISLEHLLIGLEKVIRRLPDLSLDVPHATVHCAYILGRLLVDKVIVLDSVMDLILGDKHSHNHIPPLVPDLLSEVARLTDYQTMTRMWESSEKVRSFPRPSITITGSS